MRPRTVLVLVVMALALGSVLWFFERDLPSSEERTERAGRLLGFDTESIAALDIETATAEIRLERVESEGEAAPANSSEWRLTRPLAARADAAKVEAFLTALVELPRKRTLEGVSNADVGLEEPRGRLGVTSSEGVVRFAIGAQVPASSDLVIGLDGEETLVTSSEFWDQASVEVDEWRSREIVVVPAGEIERLEVLSHDDLLVLGQRQERYVLEAPLRDDADEERARELFEEVAGLQAETFIDGDVDPAELGLEPGAAEIRISTADGEPLVIRLATPREDTDRVVGQADGQYFEASTAILDLLGATVEDWQSKAWTETEVYDVESVEIIAGDETVRLERSAGEWTRNGEPISYSLVSDVLYAVTDLQGTRVQEPSRSGSAPYLELALATGSEGERLSLIPVGGEEFVARRSTREFEVVVSGEEVRKLTAKLDALRAATPLESVGEGGD